MARVTHLLSHRVGAWLAEISEDQNLIVVSHGAAGRVIRGVYGNMAPGVAIGLTELQDAFFLYPKVPFRRSRSAYKALQLLSIKQ